MMLTVLLLFAEASDHSYILMWQDAHIFLLQWREADIYHAIFQKTGTFFQRKKMTS